MTVRLLVDVFRLIRDGSDEEAISLLKQIRLEDSESHLAMYLLHYISARRTDAVYDEPRAFQAFIDGGGNIPLYSNVVSTLSRLISIDTKSLLDIGCGDGRVTSQICGGLQYVEIVEPSPPLFRAALSSLLDRNVSTRGHNSTVQAFLSQIPAERRWDMATMTFSFQCVSPPERHQVLSRFRQQVGKVVVVEFDVPTFATELDKFQSLIARYEKGISEYSADRELVAMGFLMPMLISQLRSQHSDPINWEQPKAVWVEEFRRAGYSNVACQSVLDYWWSDCFAVIAS